VRRNHRDVPHLRAFQEGLTRALGPEKTAEIVDNVGLRYGQLFDERRRYENNALQRHLDENILPGLALYQVLRDDGYAEDKALEIAGGAFEAWGDRQRRTMAMMGKLPFYYGAIRLLVRPMMSRAFPCQGWDIAWREVSAQVVAFDIQRCFYLDTLRAYGVEELTSIYCDLDDLIYEGVSPHVAWERTRTLGRGDDVCDFRFRNAQ
jgi:hypothetical protein